MTTEAARDALLPLYEQFILPGDLCFDIGANLGDKTMTMLHAGARVVCVEPQSACVQELLERFSQEPAVTIVRAAAGEEPGELELKCCGEASTISTMSDRWTTGRFSNYTWDTTEIVRVTTLDALASEYGAPRFCKIDVEGYERNVLSGLSIPPAFLCFEFTEEFFDDATSCVERLGRIGMKEFNFAIGETPRLELGDWVSAPALLSAVVEHFDGDCWGDVYARAEGADGEPHTDSDGGVFARSHCEEAR